MKPLLARMAGWFTAMLSEAGGVSSVRFCMMAWFAVLFTAWVIQSISRHALAEIPASVLTFSGLMLTAKVAQKAAE